MKKFICIFILLLAVIGCVNSTTDKADNTYNYEREPEYKGNDRMITYYVIGGMNAFYKAINAGAGEDPQYTTDDLIESSKLLVTEGGIIKEIEIGQWYKVDNYYIRTACEGWKRIIIKYTDKLYGKREFEIYLPEHCL